MNTQCFASAGPAPHFSHELRFTSVHNPGRGLVVPCDATGHVDLDSLTERLRDAYLAARALMGREYLYPTLQPAH